MDKGSRYISFDIEATTALKAIAKNLGKIADNMGYLTDQKLTTEVTVNTFLAGAVGDPLGKGAITTDLDLWAIDETKRLQHKTKGEYNEL